jgi:hypothetical protein
MSERRQYQTAIPKIIWMLWLQGFEAAPNLVQQCVRSWQRHHPDWKLVLLDRQNLHEYVEVEDTLGQNRATITPQALSNIIRINLLAKFGGVWVDATCFCCRPLDEWLWNHTASGFFAFANPGPDRLLSSWFLVSSPDCHLTKAYCQAVNQYWRRNYFPHQQTRLGRKIIRQANKILLRNTRLSALWVHPLTAKILRLHPYHWFHYLFYRVLATDGRSQELWQATRKISADIPHRLHFAGLLSPATAEVKAAIDGRQDPLYKLNWRREKDLVPGCTMDYLLRTF